MSETTTQDLELKIEALETLIKKVKNELSINKQLLQRTLNEEPTSSIAIGELTAITDDEMSDNPQLVFEHATGTKRGYLSQILEEVIAEIPEISVNDIPPAVNSEDEGSGFGGFRYTTDGTTLNLFTS